jgi:hypothetical protein
MRRRKLAWNCLTAVAFLVGCDNSTSEQQQNSVRPPDAVIRKAVFYLKSEVPKKVGHDVIVLETGETVHVQLHTLTVPPTFQRSIFFEHARELKKGTPDMTFAVILDRASGRLCLEGGSCAPASAICPPKAQLVAGAKCEVFEIGMK